MAENQLVLNSDITHLVQIEQNKFAEYPNINVKVDKKNFLDVPLTPILKRKIILAAFL